MSIKAIETRYGGFRFRSRLEARWAVLFDSLNIQYEYEPEGFELSNGIQYLPDFFLTNTFPELDRRCTKPGYRNVKGGWLEIKPFNLSFEEHEKCRFLHEEFGQEVMALCGDIGSKNFIWHHWEKGHCICGNHFSSSPAPFGWNSFVSGISVPCTSVELDYATKDVHYHEVGPYPLMELVSRYSAIGSRLTLEEATEKARSARFEHGESG